MTDEAHPAVLRLQDIRERAHKEADEIAAGGGPLAHLFAWEAFNLARRITEDDCSPNEFASAFGGLLEYHTRAKKARPVEVAPGQVVRLGRRVGNSAVAIALDFAEGVLAAATVHRGNWNESLSWEVSPDCDPRIADWQGRTREELAMHTFPPAAEWPLWKREADLDEISLRLKNEIRAAFEAERGPRVERAAEPEATGPTWTRVEAAQALEVSPARISQLAKEGRIDRVGAGKLTRYTRASVLRIRGETLHRDAVRDDVDIRQDGKRMGKE